MNNPGSEDVMIEKSKDNVALYESLPVIALPCPLGEKLLQRSIMKESESVNL